MDKKSSNDPLSVSFAANANLPEVEKTRINLMKIKSQQGRAEAQRHQLAAERLRLSQRRTQITNTHQQRHDRTAKQLENMRRPGPQHIPGEVRGANGRAIPLTPRDLADIQRQGDSRSRGQNQQIADRIDNRAHQLLNKKLEKIIAQEQQAERENKPTRRTSRYEENARDITTERSKNRKQFSRAAQRASGRETGPERELEP